jgi:uncharacterized membrane protein
METITTIMLTVHIIAGGGSLILFWVPVFTKKGNRLHRQTGKWYVYLMWVVVITAALLSLKNAWIGNTNGALFLGFLSVLTASPLWYGVSVLNNKKTLSKRYLLLHRVINGAVASFGIFLLIYGGFYQPDGINFLMVFFGLLGLTGLIEIKRSYRVLARSTNWYKTHYTGMIISGIAAYTAFFAFGGRRILGNVLSGSWELIPWILPTVIGVIAIRKLDRYYTKKGLINA